MDPQDDLPINFSVVPFREMEGRQKQPQSTIGTECCSYSIWNPNALLFFLSNQDYWLDWKQENKTINVLECLYYRS